MGLYSVFLALGQIIGSILEDVAADWRGIDGILIATMLALVIALIPLGRLRTVEHSSTEGSRVRSPSADAGRRRAIRDGVTRDPRSDGCRPRPPDPYHHRDAGGGPVREPSRIVTDSASRQSISGPSRLGIVVVPLIVKFGSDSTGPDST